ncbi:putative Killer kp4 [Seiridium cardinale]
MHSVITIVLGFLSLASGLGINCKGSSLCKSAGANLEQIASYVNDEVTTDPGRKVPAGGGNICVENLCAFTQNTDKEITIEEVQKYVKGLQDNKCTICGSIPLDGGDDVKKGQLTVNYVANPPFYGKPGKCNNNPQPSCPGTNCYSLFSKAGACYAACCQGPTPITNPLSCASVPEQCSCAHQCGCCV